MWIVEVIPIKKGLPQETLTYFSAEPVTDGMLVSVPIRSKLIDAVVIGVRDAREEKSAIKSGSFSLKKVAKIKKDITIPYYVFETATLASRYYRRTRGEILNLIIPDYSLHGTFAKKMPFKNSAVESNETGEKIQSERLIFQSPLEDRMSFYKTCIRESFARKESVTFICPTISDCELFTETLSKGISDFVVTLHSEISKKKCSEIVAKLANEKHPFVVIATPSFASLMRDDMQTMILEHENSNAYNTPTTPSFDFRVIVEILARTAGKKLIIGDSLLRVETLGRYESKELGSIGSVTFRALTPIEISVIPHGVPEELPKGSRNEQIPALSEEAQKIITRGVEKKSHIFAFALRTGLATITRCRDCGFVFACEYCSSPLVLYQNGSDRRIYICNKCKRHKPSESRCMRCNSWNLSAHGLGTEFVEQEIKRLFPDIPVFRIDRDTTPSRALARKVAAQFSASESGILVGTEMALFYLGDSVSDSIIVSFDTLFNIPSYRTNERIVGLMLSIAERTKGKLYIQTKNPHEPIIDLMRSNNYASWYRAELAERLEYNYPPASTILKITWAGKDSEKEAVRDYLKELLLPYLPDIFDTEIIRNGKKVSAINTIIRPKRDDWSLYALLDGKGLSEILRETLSKLPEGTILNVNPDNLL